MGENALGETTGAKRDWAKLPRANPASQVLPGIKLKFGAREKALVTLQGQVALLLAVFCVTHRSRGIALNAYGLNDALVGRTHLDY